MIFFRNYGWLSFEGFIEFYNETMEADLTIFVRYLVVRFGKYNLF